jgi:hypothetical protein
MEVNLTINMRRAHLKWNLLMNHLHDHAIFVTRMVLHCPCLSALHFHHLDPPSKLIYNKRAPILMRNVTYTHLGIHQLKLPHALHLVVHNHANIDIHAHLCQCVVLNIIDGQTVLRLVEAHVLLASTRWSANHPNMDGVANSGSTFA